MGNGDQAALDRLMPVVYLEKDRATLSHHFGARGGFKPLTFSPEGRILVTRSESQNALKLCSALNWSEVSMRAIRIVYHIPLLDHS